MIPKALIVTSIHSFLFIHLKHPRQSVSTQSYIAVPNRNSKKHQGEGNRRTFTGYTSNRFFNSPHLSLITFAFASRVIVVTPKSPVFEATMVSQNISSFFLCSSCFVINSDANRQRLASALCFMLNCCCCCC